jgi:hypothetical protein
VEEIIKGIDFGISTFVPIQHRDTSASGGYEIIVCIYFIIDVTMPWRIQNILERWSNYCLKNINNIIQAAAKKGALLAPLAGISNLPFRLIARSQGCSMAYTEMISSNGLVRNTRKTYDYLKTCSDDRPLGAQISALIRKSWPTLPELLKVPVLI